MVREAMVATARKPAQSGLVRTFDSLNPATDEPVATFAIGRAGAVNSALYAIAFLASKHPEYRKKLLDYRARQTESILANPDPRQPI